jgi:hypothetical protein
MVVVVPHFVTYKKEVFYENPAASQFKIRGNNSEYRTRGFYPVLS